MYGPRFRRALVCITGICVSPLCTLSTESGATSETEAALHQARRSKREVKYTCKPFRGGSGQPVTDSTTIASSTRSSFQVGRVRILFTHSDLSGLEDTPKFFWYMFASGRTIHSRLLGSTARILNILRIKYRCGRSRTQFWRGQTNVNKPHSFG